MEGQLFELEKRHKAFQYGEEIFTVRNWSPDTCISINNLLEEYGELNYQMCL